MYIYTCMWVCTRVSMRACIYTCMWLCVWWYRPVWWDPDLLREIYFGARYEPDTLAIRRPTHEKIRRFVLVRAVETRRRFGSKIVSFHVSVRSYVFLYLLLLVDVSASVHIISCDCMIYFISMFTSMTSWGIVNVYFSVIAHYRYLLFKLLPCSDNDYTC